MWDARQETDSVESVIREIEFGRGQSQLFDMGLGGQQERKYYSPDELEADTLDLLRALQPYEVQLKPYFRTDDEYYRCVWFDIEEYVESIFKGAELLRSDNTFNYSQPLSNHVHVYTFAYPNVEEWLIYAIQIHLHGDVRGNYSPWMIFSLSWEQLYEAWVEARRDVPIEVEGFEGNITIYPDEQEVHVRVEDESGEVIEFEMSAYTVSEVVEEVEERIRELVGGEVDGKADE